MTKSEFDILIKNAQLASSKEGKYFVGKTIGSLLLCMIVVAIFVEGNGDLPFIGRVIAVGALVAMFISMIYFGKQSENLQKRIRAKTPCCGEEIFPIDVKIITASGSCPYCGETIMEKL